MVAIQKINLSCLLTLLIGSLTLLMGYKIHLCGNFFSEDLIYLIPFFSTIVWIEKLHYLMKGFFLNKVCHGKKNRFFSVFKAAIAKRKNASSKTWILILPQWRLSWLDKFYARLNVTTSKMYILRKTEK